MDQRALNMRSLANHRWHFVPVRLFGLIDSAKYCLSIYFFEFAQCRPLFKSHFTTYANRLKHIQTSLEPSLLFFANPARTMSPFLLGTHLITTERALLYDSLLYLILPKKKNLGIRVD